MERKRITNASQDAVKVHRKWGQAFILKWRGTKRSSTETNKSAKKRNGIWVRSETAIAQENHTRLSKIVSRSCRMYLLYSASLPSQTYMFFGLKCLAFSSTKRWTFSFFTLSSERFLLVVRAAQETDENCNDRGQNDREQVRSARKQSDHNNRKKNEDQIEQNYLHSPEWVDYERWRRKAHDYRGEQWDKPNQVIIDVLNIPQHGLQKSGWWKMVMCVGF